MKYSLAPMEGITGYTYRRAFESCFGPMDQYYTPFLSPNSARSFMKREQKEVEPEHNAGLPVVPQLLTRNAEDFLWASERFAEYGYKEVNLNLGCPSGTVAAKGKGSGFLSFPEELDLFLEKVFRESPLPVSIKTRIGRNADEEFPRLLAIYRRYPISLLIVHPRIQKDFYKVPPRREPFRLAMQDSPFPVCYNGDIFCREDYEELISEFPDLDMVMLGRGILVNPGLLRELRGGAPAAKAELREFHECLLDGYVEEFRGDRNLLYRMKELWTYFRYSFEEPERCRRLVRKAGNLAEYRAAVNEIFHMENVRPIGGFSFGK